MVVQMRGEEGDEAPLESEVCGCGGDGGVSRQTGAAATATSKTRQCVDGRQKTTCHDIDAMQTPQMQSVAAAMRAAGGRTGAARTGWARGADGRKE